MKQLRSITIGSFIFLALFGVSMGQIVHAEIESDSGLVQCGRDDSGSTAQEQAEDCNFAAFFALINTIINYFIILAMPLTAIAFMYAGFIYLTAAGNGGKVDQAKKIFWNVAIGFGIILSAWLVFKFIGNAFLTNGYGTYLQ